MLKYENSAHRRGSGVVHGNAPWATPDPMKNSTSPALQSGCRTVVMSWHFRTSSGVGKDALGDLMQPGTMRHGGHGQRSECVSTKTNRKKNRSFCGAIDYCGSSQTLWLPGQTAKTTIVRVAHINRYTSNSTMQTCSQFRATHR